MTHYVGQLVRVDCPSSLSHGEKTTIRRINVHGYELGKPFTGHEVDIPCLTSSISYAIFEPHELIPIDDRGSWDEIERVTGWKPGVPCETQP